MPTTIAILRKDMAKLAAELGQLAAEPLSPFSATDQARLASLSGSAVQATTHLAVVDAGGGPKTSTAKDMDKCDADSAAITGKLQKVISQDAPIPDSARTLLDETSKAINEAYAIV